MHACLVIRIQDMLNYIVLRYYKLIGMTNLSKNTSVYYILYIKNYAFGVKEGEKRSVQNRCYETPEMCGLEQEID